MYKDKKIVAIIPARKGSKGIPNKNIKKLNGIPLIEYTIKQAKDVNVFDKIIISTDSEEIVEIAKKYNVLIPNMRPSHLASDTAALYDVLKYEIENYRLMEEKHDIIVLLQPTSPLRPSFIIADAVRKFIDEEQESAVSVSEVEEHPVFIRTITNNKLNKILPYDSTIRRQDLPSYYRVNGMIYINKIQDINDGYVSFNDNLSPIIVDREYAIDIDTIEDFKKAEEILKGV